MLPPVSFVISCHRYPSGPQHQIVLLSGTQFNITFQGKFAESDHGPSTTVEDLGPNVLEALGRVTAEWKVAPSTSRLVKIDSGKGDTGTAGVNSTCSCGTLHTNRGRHRL